MFILTIMAFVLHRLPFNWQTPLGFFIAELLESVSYASLLLCVILTLFYYVASLWLIIKFTEDIANDLELLNVGGTSDHSHMLMHERFGKIVEMHSKLKQLSSKIIHSTIKNLFQITHFFLNFSIDGTSALIVSG